VRWFQNWRDKPAEVSDTWLRNFRDGLYPLDCIGDAHLQPVTTRYDGERIADYQALVPELRPPSKV
jgi:hypothetical protein